MKAGVFFSFGGLKCLENLVSDLDRVGQALETWSELFKFIVPEVAVSYPGSEDKIVIGHGHLLAVCGVSEYAPPLLVHARDLAHDDRRVFLCS